MGEEIQGEHTQNVSVEIHLEILHNPLDIPSICGHPAFRTPDLPLFLVNWNSFNFLAAHSSERNQSVLNRSL